MTYYLLIHREGPRDDLPWVVAFGDCDRSCVEFERDDMASGNDPIAKRWSKIVRFPRVPTARQLDTYMAQLNEGLA